MTVGVGLPDHLLEEIIASRKITKKNLMPTLLDLLSQEIAATEHYIEQHRGVGIYQDNCTRWGFHLEAYRRVQDIIKMISK